MIMLTERISMDGPTIPPIFDGHNDVLLNLFEAEDRDISSFASGLPGAVDLAKARKGGFAGGFFAVYVPSRNDESYDYSDMDQPSYDLPLPKPVPWAEAARVALSEAAILFDLERRGYLRVCRTVSDIRSAMDDNVIAAIFHIEGAEAIDEDLHALDVLYQAGLRSIGPVWSRPTIFGHGVPFRYPGDPDTGDGLTQAGQRLVERCNALGIMVDLSHMNAAGFWDVAKITTKPLVATHSNAHALCPVTRNLTDKQLDAIRDSDGMVGVNLAASFLRPDGRMTPEVAIEQVLRHFDYLIERLGEDRVGLGSDYDGAVVPKDLKTIAHLPNLRTAMLGHGYGAALMEKLCFQNWLRVLDKTW